MPHRAKKVVYERITKFINLHIFNRELQAINESILTKKKILTFFKDQEDVECG